MLLHIVLALLPVLIFLAVLLLMDSFKLAPPSSIVLALGWGIVAAFICNEVHGFLQSLGLQEVALSRYIAPITEETVKGSFIVYVLLRGRVGFLVDAAQIGFAVGTGFALLENSQYLLALHDAGTLLWIVRGLGTAMLHGATTALFAMASKTAFDRNPNRKTLIFLPGWALAVIVHSAFNHLPLSPVAMTAALLLALPVLMLLVFERSERATREWVTAGLDLDLELLNLVSSDAFTYTRFGKYLEELRKRFRGTVVADMFCLLRVELELSIQVKAMLMAREAGLVTPVHPDAASALDEIRFLRASIGRTGLLALHPLQVTTHRDTWHRHLVQGKKMNRRRVADSDAAH